MLIILLSLQAIRSVSRSYNVGFYTQASTGAVGIHAPMAVHTDHIISVVRESRELLSCTVVTLKILQTDYYESFKMWLK